MSEDVISRREAMNIAYDWADVNSEELIKRLNDLPPVTPARPKGKWILDDYTEMDYEGSSTQPMVWVLVCPKCGIHYFDIEDAVQNGMPSYCPYCGVDTREGEE